MAITRSALAYMRRKGIIPESQRPATRLDLAALLVHTVPLAAPPMPGESVLRSFEGMPPPDRGVSRPWPSET